MERPDWAAHECVERSAGSAGRTTASRTKKTATVVKCSLYEKYQQSDGARGTY